MQILSIVAAVHFLAEVFWCKTDVAAVKGVVEHPSSKVISSLVEVVLVRHLRWSDSTQVNKVTNGQRPTIRRRAQLLTEQGTFRGSPRQGHPAEHSCARGMRHYWQGSTGGSGSSSALSVGGSVGKDRTCRDSYFPAANFRCQCEEIFRSVVSDGLGRDARQYLMLFANN